MADENKPKAHPATSGGHHFIFSAEKPRAENKTGMTPSDVLAKLRSWGETVEETRGKYTEPENSFIVHEPKNIHKLHNLAANLGQESAIISDKGRHSLHYYNGPFAGKIRDGEGTQVHTEEPENNYTKITNHDGSHSYFSHNFDWNNDNLRVDLGKKEITSRLLSAFGGSEMDSYLGKSRDVRTENRVYVIVDGDATGAYIARSALANNPEEVIEKFENIVQGKKLIKKWAFINNADIVFDGSDKFSFTLPVDKIPELESLRRSYRERTGLTISIGVGSSNDNAKDSVLYGKLTHKGEITTHSPEIEKSLKESAADKETKIIRENAKDPENQKKHKFKAAKWTHPNGHPRCSLCGDEEAIDGFCSPKINKDELPGGKGDEAKISDFDPKEFTMGMKVELEHTKDHKVASEIVRDHLTENKKYYSKLKETGLADELEKHVFKNNTWYPEASDPDGSKHPERTDKVKGTAANGKPAYYYGPEAAGKDERKFTQRILNHRKKSDMSLSGKDMIIKLAQKIAVDPDRHAIPSGTTPNAPEGHQELRLRHLSAAAGGEPGYELTEHEGGIKITAPRHSGSDKSNVKSSSWHFDGKNLKFLGNVPISNIPQGVTNGNDRGTASENVRHGGSDVGSGSPRKMGKSESFAGAYGGRIGRSESVSQDLVSLDKSTVSRDYEVPYGAGYNKAADCIYIDKRLPRSFTTKAGKVVDIDKYLKIHEEIEKHLEDKKGYNYKYAHTKATGDERKAVEDDGIDWKEYQNFILGAIKKLPKLDSAVPKDIDLKPEEDYHDTKTIKEAKVHGALGKAEGTTKLIHYSTTSGLSHVDPNKMGTGIGSKGLESKYGKPSVERSYFYRDGTTPEPMVVSGAKSRYTAELEPHHKLYDVGADPDNLREKAKASGVNPGIATQDEYLQQVKDAGYHGFHNPASGLPGAVALFYKHPVKEDTSFIKNETELTAEELEKSKNVKEQKAKVYGKTSDPTAGPMRDKHNSAFEKFASKRYNVKTKQTGSHTSETGKVVTDKPNWRSGDLEYQPTPDAGIHEAAHLEQMPEGSTMGEHQEDMNTQWGEVNKPVKNGGYGWMSAKQTQGEIQPMAAENLLRRRAGLPATRIERKISDKDPKTGKSITRRATESDPLPLARDTGTPAAVRGKTPKGETTDFIRQSRLLSPENRDRTERIDSGELIHDPDRGWVENTSINAKINRKVRMGAEAYFKKRLEGAKIKEAIEPLASSELTKANTLDYSKINKPKEQPAAPKTLDYAQMNTIHQKPEAKESLDYGKMNSIKQKPSSEKTLDYSKMNAPTPPSATEKFATTSALTDKEKAYTALQEIGRRNASNKALGDTTHTANMPMDGLDNKTKKINYFKSKLPKP